MVVCLVNEVVFCAGFGAQGAPYAGEHDTGL